MEVGQAIAVGIALDDGMAVPLHGMQLAGLLGEALIADELEALVAALSGIGIDAGEIDDITIAEILDLVLPINAMGQVGERLENETVLTLALRSGGSGGVRLVPYADRARRDEVLAGRIADR